MSQLPISLAPGATPASPPTQAPLRRPTAMWLANLDSYGVGRLPPPTKKDWGCLQYNHRAPIQVHTGSVSKQNAGGLGTQPWVLGSRAVWPELPHPEQGEGGNKQTAMPMPVQKNYTIYIYIYIQYINLFLLSPATPPSPPQKKNPKSCQ